MFSRIIQTLKTIDFLTLDIDEIVDRFAVVEEFLYGVERDEQLENIVNKKRKK